VAKPRLRTVKKAGRLAGAARGIFKKVGLKLKKAKGLPNRGIAPSVTKAAKSTPHKLPRPPRTLKPGAAPYRPELASRVPPYGTKGKKVTGVVDLGGKRVVGPFDSGYGGPAQKLPKPRRGMDGNLVSHVEANTVARMRQNGVKEATLYINKRPCSYDRGGSLGGCEVMLKRMLQKGEKLTVYGPNGYHNVFYGE
jgi:Double-stranded DNA deaminase toxin A